jgi:hypothetical protein
LTKGQHAKKVGSGISFEEFKRTIVLLSIRIIIFAKYPDSLKIKAGEPGSQADRFSLDYISKGDDFEDSLRFMVAHLTNAENKANLRFPQVPDKKINFN